MKSIADIRRELEQADGKKLEELLVLYGNDPRKGVVSLTETYKRKRERLEKERERLARMRVYEKKYEHVGLICGIDEAGRGPLAGPVVAGAVILPADCEILYLNDSKQLSAKKREELYDEIREKALAAGVGIVDHERIDEINILQATYEAMQKAVASLGIMPQILLNDAVTIPGIEIPQVPIIGGDAKSLSIAAASVIAKVTRDRIMCEYDREMPQYGFASHKGYGTATHVEAVRKYGPSRIHRISFLKNILGQDWQTAGKGAHD